MSPRTERTVPRSARTVLASIGVSVLVLAGSGTPASAAPAAMILSNSSGPSGGGSTIVGTVVPTTALPTPFPANTTPTVQFQTVGAGTAGCATTAQAITEITGTSTANSAGVLTVDPAAVKRISTSKIAFAVPSGPNPDDPDNANADGLALLPSQTSSKWNVCVYDSDSTTSSTLLAAASYSVALRPAITSITPANSPAGGGQTITVNGVGFTALATTVTGSIGGTALSNIQIAPDGESLTATTGARTPDTGLALTLKTPGGTVSSLDPDNDPNTNNPIPFSYSNGITISPTTAPSGSLVTIDVNGAGFSQLNFETLGSPTSALAHVFLVDGEYTASGNRGVAECVVSAVVSDTELVCDLDLRVFRLNLTNSAPVNGQYVVDGAYILTVVEDGSTGAMAPNPSIVSSGAAFVVAPY